MSTKFQEVQRNNATVNACMRAGGTQEENYQLAIEMLVEQNNKLIEEVKNLQLIAPRMFIGKDGTKHRFDVPDDHVPIIRVI
jgi:hypothetical protein